MRPAFRLAVFSELPDTRAHDIHLGVFPMGTVRDCVDRTVRFAELRLAQSTNASRPNIVFILTDDQRFDTMGCAGNRIIQTPQMDALARDGVRFRNAFVTTPICAASRASILSGVHERTHRFTFNTPPVADTFVDTSYPAQLKHAGYRTGFVGKFGVNVLQGAANRMVDYFRPLNRTPYFKKQPDGTERHLTDIEGDKALAFFDSCKPGEPFQLSISFNAPHAEDDDPRQYFWPRDFDGLYRDAVLPTPRTMTNGLFETLPAFLQDSESRVRFNWRFDEPEKYQAMVKGYYRMITSCDRVIGRVRDELKKRGCADNTVIVFTSDNGYFLGERGFADKWYIYEYSVRMPLIVFDPRAPAAQRGRVEEAMALNIDFAPTMLELAGVSPPKIYQGRSLLPLLRGEKPSGWRTDFFVEHLFERWNIPKSEGVRGERFSYVRWFEQKPLVEELYDHEADFEQTNNLVNNPQFSEVLAKLRKRTTELRDQYGGEFVPNALKPSVKPPPKRAADKTTPAKPAR